MHLLMIEIILVYDNYHFKAVKIEVMPRIGTRNLLNVIQTIFAGIRLPTII